jgi:hypothetical protein
VNLDEPYVAEAADSDERPSGPPSAGSASDIHWAALAEEVPEDEAKFDAPSDRDLLADEPAAGDAAAGREPYVAEPGSNVDLEEPFPASAAEDSASAIDLAALAGQSATGSSLHGGPAGEAPPADAGATEVEDGGAPPARPGAGAADTRFLDDVAEVEAGSAVNLGEATRPTDRPSSRDLIAEAVESGVDMASGPALGRPEVPGSESELDLTTAAAAAQAAETAAAGPSSSSGPDAVRERSGKPAGRHDSDADDEESSDKVDLGSHETAALAEPPAGPSSEVDLAGKRGRARQRPASSPSASDVVDLTGGSAEAEEVAEEEAAPARAEEEERPAPRARAGAGRALVGGAVGLLIGLVAAFALWLFGVEPPAGWRLAETKGSGNALRQQPVGPNPAPGAGAPAAADPGEQLKRGDFAKAVEGFKSAPDNPETQAQRGTARWLAYLQEQKSKNAALNAGDEAVKQARTDLEAAAQKENPEALLTLGHLQEWTGAPADAAKTYQDGLKRFGGNARWTRAFQAQLNRLESATASPADGGKPRAGLDRPGNNAAAQALVALLLAFQAGQPDPGAAADDDEAGFEFWAAVKSARASDYDAALKSLETARKAHDKLRFARLRKAQNPLSDPTEEIFLRSAQEIQAYWSLQNYLKQQNLLAKGDDPQKAIAAAVQGAAALQAQVKKVADNLGTTPDKLGASIDALVKEKDEAAKKAAALATDLATAKKDSDTAKKEAKDVGDRLARAGEQLKTAEGKLKAVGERLAAAGATDADPAKGIDTLAAERAAADKMLSAVADKLAGANVRVDKKDVVQGVERVVQVARQKEPKGVEPPPVVRRPPSTEQPNPLLAEAHYAAGLRAYFGGRFADAEADFDAAVQCDRKDARYFYFLGLSRLALGEAREANADFEEGARLERDNLPARKVVSTALERIQGAPRQALNRFRP